MPTTAVTAPLPQEALAVLRAAGEVREAPPGLAARDLPAHVRGAHALVVTLSDRVDDALLEAAGAQLAVVATVSVGHDNVDVAACARRGVRVANTPGVLTDATADLAVALMLAVTRRVGEGERLVRAQRPWSWSLGFLLGTSLAGARLGVVGLGQIGSAVARRAEAFGMEVVHAGRRPPGPGEGTGPRPRLALQELLETSDVVSLHCPLTPQTHHLVDAAALARMQPGAYLVNTARGAVVDEAALVAALEAGRLRGAALDVFEHEPAVHPGLLGREDVVLTPHLGSATTQTRTAMAVLAARSAAAVLAGGDPLAEVVAPRA